MKNDDIEKTDPDEERRKGRIALWLDVADLRWLAADWQVDDGASPEERERWARLKFRANAALHKAGEK